MNKNVTSEAAAGNASKTKRGLDLSPIQIIAGGGAAAVASVIGGQLGLGGTVVGAFVLSVVSAVAVPLFRASLEKSHEQLKRVVPRRGSEETKASPQMAPDPADIIRTASSKVSASPLPGEGAEAAPGVRQRRSVTNRARMAAAGTAAIFVVGLGSVLGVQAATGMSLSSGTAALQKGISQVASNGANNTRSTPVTSAQPSAKAADAGVHQPGPGDYSLSRSHGQGQPETDNPCRHCVIAGFRWSYPGSPFGQPRQRRVWNRCTGRPRPHDGDRRRCCQVSQSAMSAAPMPA